MHGYLLSGSIEPLARNLSSRKSDPECVAHSLQKRNIAAADVSDYVESFYNQRRRHSHIACRAEFVCRISAAHRQVTTAQQAARLSKSYFPRLRKSLPRVPGNMNRDCAIANLFWSNAERFHCLRDLRTALSTKRALRPKNSIGADQALGMSM